MSNSITLDPKNETVKAIVFRVRGEVRGMVAYADYVKAFNVTADTVKDHARAIADLAFPKYKGVQAVDGVRTEYGNAVQAAGNGLRRALGKDENGGEDAPKSLLTTAGKHATLDEVIAAWKDAQA